MNLRLISIAVAVIAILIVILLGYYYAGNHCDGDASASGCLGCKCDYWSKQKSSSNRCSICCKKSSKPITIKANHVYKMCGCRNGKYGTAIADEQCNSQNVPPPWQSGYKCAWKDANGDWVALNTPSGTQHGILQSTGCMATGVDFGDIGAGCPYGNCNWIRDIILPLVVAASVVIALTFHSPLSGHLQSLLRSRRGQK